MKTKTAPKIITVALLRDLETQVHIKQEISYSRMVEILNEKATQQVTAATEEIKRERDEYYDTLQEYRLKTADMEKRIQELEAHVPKWIGVKDRLPDLNGDYLISMSGKNESGVMSFKDRNWGFYYGAVFYKTNFNVEYWSNIPQPIK